MVAAAAKRGYGYYAVTDHAPNLYMQRMTREKALAQRERVQPAGRRLPGAATAARHRVEHRSGGRRRLAERNSWRSSICASRRCIRTSGSRGPR
ncbi:hypothetical protein ACFSTC_55585 [Nonomuraea ferruginea]